jgi:hypothetical protein
MKQSTLRAIAAFGLIAVFQPLLATAAQPMVFHVPFDFTVGEKSFPAGTYRVTQPNDQFVVVQAANYSQSIMALTMTDDPGKDAGANTLSFTRYGDRYFLSKIANYSHGSRLHESAVEREMARRERHGSLAVIAASKK